MVVRLVAGGIEKRLCGEKEKAPLAQGLILWAKIREVRLRSHSAAYGGRQKFGVDAGRADRSRAIAAAGCQTGLRDPGHIAF